MRELDGARVCELENSNWWGTSDERVGLPHREGRETSKSFQDPPGSVHNIS